MSARSSHPARLEDAIVARLEPLNVRSDLNRFDLKAAPADEDGWKSHAAFNCRVIWGGSNYDGVRGLGAEMRRRRTEIMLSWRFKLLNADQDQAYAYLEAALLLLNGWTPRLTPDAPKLGDAFEIGRERLVDVSQLGWTYEQRFTTTDYVATPREEDVLAAVTRITTRTADGDDLDPPVDVTGEAA